MGFAIPRCILPCLLGIAWLASGCVSVREFVGLPAESTPSVTQSRAAQNWLLIKNPRYGDVPSEPEHIWVEEDRVPTTLRTLVFSKKSIIAPPEVVAKYGAPPGGGRISPLQGAPYTVPDPAPVKSSGREGKAEGKAKPGTAAAGEANGLPRGYVVFVDTTRVVVDLTAKDGLRPGSIVSLRRDKIPIVHPVTGELLGELDEEVATAKVVEVREKFSVAEIQGIAPGAQIKLKDRVVIR
jgi:hypothetical protein